jgi:V8-like Glu-specific endopeptidase
VFSNTFGRTRSAAFLIALSMLIAPAAAAAESRIVNGVMTHDFPTTGQLLYSQSGVAITANNAGSWCSGTLIGCRTFLTAAHCVVDDTAASHYWVYLQNGGIHTVSSIAYHPNYDPDLSGRDVAIVKLGADVTGIDPTPINSTHNLQAMGTGLAGVIAGFGRTGGGSDYGVKRWGQVTTSACNQTYVDEGEDKLVCWNYTNPIGPAGEDSNTCNGDSGGPLFMEFAGVTEVVGITSAGVVADCGAGDHSWDASVYYNAAWITGQLGADPTATCGGIPAVGDPGVTVFGHSGNLSTNNTSDAFQIALEGSPSLLRVALNGINPAFNPNLYIKAGGSVSTISYDCKADGSSAFGACQIVNPAPGTWSILVQRGSGSGDYQVTSTAFGTSLPVCGDNVAEGGEACDGTDLGSCAVGPCSGCECPAPVCGNNSVESGETCDGTSDGACPGLCLGDCSCQLPVCGNGVVEDGEECDGASDSACPGDCLSDCSCPGSCEMGDLYGLSILSDAYRFRYKAQLFDPASEYADLDPRAHNFTLKISEGAGMVDLQVSMNDIGWVRADPVRRKYGWKGDGSLDGLRRIKLVYKNVLPEPFWLLLVKGKLVTGAGSIDISNVLDFELGFDGTCHLESW